MKSTLVCLSVLAASTLAAPLAIAEEICEDERPIEIAENVYLIMDSPLSGGYIVHFALYAETNGQPGLQRGGASPLGTPDPCHGPNPDTLLFASYETI